MLFLARFKSGRVKPPTLHLARKILVAARIADMEVPVAGSINPPRIVYHPAHIARKSLRRLTTLAITQNLLGLLDEIPVYSIFLHTSNFGILTDCTISTNSVHEYLRFPTRSSGG